MNCTECNDCLNEITTLHGHLDRDEREWLSAICAFAKNCGEVEKIFLFVRAKEALIKFLERQGCSVSEIDDILLTYRSNLKNGDMSAEEIFENHKKSKGPPFGKM